MQKGMGVSMQRARMGRTTGIALDAQGEGCACLISGSGVAVCHTQRVLLPWRNDLSTKLLKHIDGLLLRHGLCASACCAVWDGSGRIELANAGDTMGVVVGAGGTRFLCVPRTGPRQRLWCYAGSGRLTSTTVERYTVNITAADRYLVLMTSEIWERLSMPSIERMCLDAQTPEDASAALVAAARAYQGRANAAAVVIRLS